MDFNPYSLILSTLFGIAGIGYWRYGRSTGNLTMVITATFLWMYPLFVVGPWLNLLVGSGLMALPWVISSLGIDF